jgi:hypothetical protein
MCQCQEYFLGLQRSHARSRTVTAQLQWARDVGIHACAKNAPIPWWHGPPLWATTMPLLPMHGLCTCAALRLGAASLDQT